MEDGTSLPDSTGCEDMEEERITKRCLLPRKHKVQSKKICAKEERNASIKKVSQILQKSETERTREEAEVLKECAETVEEVEVRRRKRDKLKRRLEEIEDPVEELQHKCQILAQAIAQSQHLVVYTGAGISTAAKIPDYRGPNGIWTRLQQGKDIGDHDLTLAEPTYTHMALSELYRRKILKYVVSQNCDGLHLRSGLPKTALSELHGNMYIEVCKTCKPHKEYWRLFDVTENTARYSHKTTRKCYACNEPLVDTIVHFGERGSLQWPLNWSGACKNAEKATTILCLGSSLKVLKKYPWLWQMDKPIKKRPNLYIVNLQWTPKDDVANVKIHGKCDYVMGKVMELLGIEVPSYNKLKDPIFIHSTDLNELEMHTTSQPLLRLNAEELREIKLEYEDCSDTDCKPDLNTMENCDKSATEHNKLPCLPKNSSTVFSIDNILQSNTLKPEVQDTPDHIPNNLLSPSLSLLGYNLFRSQIFSGISDFFLYPYQTSFLYPGLHSIINPVPFIKEEEAVVVKPSCTFCDKHHKSSSCLYYKKTKPEFVQQVFRFSKLEQKEKPNICVCCDYTTEEEDLDELDKDSSNSNDKEQMKGKIQAGWFGKGYKKCKRPKKRSSL